MSEILAETTAEPLFWGPESTSHKSGSASSDKALEPKVTFQSGIPLELTTSGPIKPQLTSRRSLHLALKRALDIVMSVSGLVILFPLLLVVALAIKLTSPGPVLFVQSRVGLGGRPFKLIKFRTISLEHMDVSGIAQTQRGDPRVTPLGRILRRKSIDELPQLINVLLGQMSIVGPRPHVSGMKAAGIDYIDLVPYYHMRTAMRPGLTGWAQANGLRGPTENAHASKARVDHDIAYIQNFSVWLDVRIIFQTFQRELLGGTGV